MQFECSLYVLKLCWLLGRETELNPFSLIKKPQATTTWVKRCQLKFSIILMYRERTYNLLFTPFRDSAHCVREGLWLAASPCSAVIARSAHSSVHWGVGLRILLATRDISPFCSLSTAPRTPIWDFIASNHLPAFSVLFWKILLTLSWTLPCGTPPTPPPLCRQERGDSSSSEELCVSTKRLVGLCSCFFWGDRFSFFVGGKSMGAQLSKTPGKAETAAEKPGEAAASPTKANGQVNEILTSSSLHPSARRRGWRGLLVVEGNCALRAQYVRNCAQMDTP